MTRKMTDIYSFDNNIITTLALMYYDQMKTIKVIDKDISLNLLF